MAKYNRPVEYYPKHYKQLVEVAYDTGIFEVEFPERKEALAQKEDFNRYLQSLKRYEPGSPQGVRSKRLLVAVMDRRKFVVINIDKAPTYLWLEMTLLNRTSGGKGTYKL